MRVSFGDIHHKVKPTKSSVKRTSCVEESIHAIFDEENYGSKEGATCDVEGFRLVLDSKDEQDERVHKGVAKTVQDPTKTEDMLVSRENDQEENTSYHLNEPGPLRTCSA